MSDTKDEAWPITARGRAFSDDEARIFNHAVTLVVAHGKQEIMFAAGSDWGEIANADIGPFRIERMVLAESRTNRKVGIGIAYQGKQVLQASFEQWKRPKRKRELSILCDVPTFVRGDWEAALLQLR